MSLPSNEQRSQRARRILNLYAGLPETGYEMREVEDDTMVTDLLSDLRHFCDRNAVDFDQCSLMAEIHHNEEVAEEAGEGYGEQKGKE